MSNFLRRHLIAALALLALLAACCLCDTLDRRPEPGKFADTIAAEYSVWPMSVAETARPLCAAVEVSFDHTTTDTLWFVWQEAGATGSGVGKWALGWWGHYEQMTR